MPKVSVLMPAYNAEKYIAEAIESILNQTYTDFELIVVNDGSTDSTERIIKSFIDKRIKYFKNEKNSGIVFTLNKGLEVCTGEYIVRMDSDDISLPQRIEKQVKYMDENTNVAVCGSNLAFIGEQSGYTDMPIGAEWCKANSFFMTPMAHPSVIIRKSVLDKYNLRYDSAFERMEDFDLWNRISEHSEIDNMKDVLIKYRIHKSQITQNHNQDEKKRWLNFKVRELKHLAFDYTDEELNAYIKYCFDFNSMSYNDVMHLESLCEKAYNANMRNNYYDSDCLYRAMKNCIWYCHNNIKLTKSQKKNIVYNSIFTPFADRATRTFKKIIKKYFLNRIGIISKKIRNVKIKIRESVEKKKLRSKLVNKDFTIISNNCWGGFIYQKYGLQYKSPTVGLYILGHDFVKFCNNFEWYIQQKLEFISWEEASYYYAIKDKEPYPIAKLEDIEIYFMHYHSNEEASEKWYRRVNRINSEHILFKLSQREECSKKDIEDFMSLPLEHKVCFAYDEVPGAINIPELKNFVGDEMDIVNKYLDDLQVLNEM